MTAIIFKYSITSKSYCDNRTIDELDELNFDIFERTAEFSIALLSNRVYEKNDHLYSLSREAIKQWEKEND